MRHLVLVLAAALFACTQPDTATTAPVDSPAVPPEDNAPAADEFAVQTEQFGDVRILRYQVPGFEQLPLEHKKLVYFLYEAALAGRDIIWDQNYRHNLAVRRTLEGIVATYSGDQKAPAFQQFLVYAKRVWFSNGIHHHYSMKKMLPECKPEDFAAFAKGSDPKSLPLADGEAIDAFVSRMTPLLFDPKLDAKRVSLDAGVDLVETSATNFYGQGVTQKDVERFYKRKVNKAAKRPPMWGLNSQLAKEKGRLVEKTWKVGGMYDPAISRIVSWLDRAVAVAESEAQKAALVKLVEFYRTGDLETFDEYSIAWVADTESSVDVVNGFIEVYGDPLGYRGAYESVVSIRDMEASKRIAAIGEEAKFFEDNSPILPEHKKKEIKGISAKVIMVVVEAGDAAPSTPIGINLPNSNWIRSEHGSKSVNLGNIVRSYEIAKRQSGVLEEFAASNEEIARAKAHGDVADALHTDMHEVIGHASGQLERGVAQPNETLKNYSNTLEEARADLVALYYMLDPKLIEIGVMKDLETGKAAYDNYIRNALLVQMARLEPGANLEEAHMRNRQMIAAWVLEKGKDAKVIEKIGKDGETAFAIRDYDALRKLFGELLREVQRIKSKGDFAAGKALVETYGVKVDPKLHEEVLARYKQLGIAPYAGFIQPRLVPIIDDKQQIVDVKIEYPTDFTQQMLEYGKNYSTLPTYAETR